MNHNDGQRCVCSECGSEFHFTTAEQRFYEERGLNFPPKRCKTCRAARKAAGPGAGRGAPGRDSGGFRDSGGGGGFRDSGGGGGFRDPGGFRGPAGYGGAPRGDDRRGPPPRFGQAAPSFQGARPQRPGGFAPRAPRFGDDRGAPRGRFDAPPPAAYGQQQDRPPPRGRDFRDPRPPQGGHEGRDSAEPRRARVAREKPKFDITCQQCGAHATVPFKPLPGRDIFCPTCYRARKSLSPEERAATSIATTNASAAVTSETSEASVTTEASVTSETATSPIVEGDSPHEE